MSAFEKKSTGRPCLQKSKMGSTNSIASIFVEILAFEDEKIRYFVDINVLINFVKKRHHGIFYEKSVIKIE